MTEETLIAKQELAERNRIIKRSKKVKMKSRLDNGVKATVLQFREMAKTGRCSPCCVLMLNAFCELAEMLEAALTLDAAIQSSTEDTSDFNVQDHSAITR